MVCPGCQTPNFRDYKFCRECGGKMPALDPAADPADGLEAQVEQFLQQAFTLLDEGRPDEALLAAQAALALNSSSASAHSVLGLLYERQGRIPEAIEAFQRVVELSPNSFADREKLNALQGAPPPVRRRLRLTPAQGAVAAAVAAGVVVFGVGLALVTGAPPAADVARGADEASGQLRPLGATPAGPGGLPKPLPTPPLAGPGSVRAAAPKPLPLIAGSPSAWRAPAPVWRPPATMWRPAPQAPPSGGAFGMPRVVHTPPRPSAGLAPAPIGDVVPIGPPPQATAADPARGPSGVFPAGASGAPETRREPLEPETGFIRIGPAKQTAPDRSGAGGPASGTAVPRPTISISVGTGLGPGETAPRK